MKKLFLTKLVSIVKGHMSIIIPVFVLFLTFGLFAQTLISPVFAQNCQDARGCAVQKDVNNIVLGLNNMLNGSDGASKQMASLIGNMYATPPVSGMSFITNEVQKFNPVQPAYAQTGVGYDLLSPTQRLWTVFRNTAYVGFVLIFVIIGFMVMFRAHISPQTVATVQDSIPRIVIALILVTFSYAIAGFLIDLMFLVINLFINILTLAGLNPAKKDLIFTDNILDISVESLTGVFKSVSSAVNEVLSNVIGSDSNPLAKVFGDIVSGVGGTALGIVAAIAMLFIMFRIFLMLLMAYIQIIILTLAAPFFFLIQSLPGNNGAKGWFRQMVANMSVFVTVSVMIMIAGILSGIEALGGSGTSQLTDAQVGAFPLISGTFGVNSIGNLIGLGFLLMTPEAAKLTKQFFGVKDLGFGAVGSNLAAGAAPLGAFGRRAAHETLTSPHSPIGAYRRERESLRGEVSSIRARKALYSSPQGGITKQDLKEFGLYGKREQGE